MNREISDELLNAFADNELDGAEKAEVLERIAADEHLRAKVCETWHLKELVRSAHPLGDKSDPKKKAERWRWLSLLLAIGASSGWVAHGDYNDTLIASAELRSIQARGGRVVLHIVSGNPDDIERTLRQVEQLAMAKSEDNRPLQVEVIANGPGIRVLQADYPQYASRIERMHDAYNNIRLVACNETMNRLRERGVAITLLPEVDVVPSAIEEIATRIDQGWRYLQV